MPSPNKRARPANDDAENDVAAAARDSTTRSAGQHDRNGAQKQQQQQQQQQQPADAPAFRRAVVDHASARLRDPRSSAASEAPLRAALQPLEGELRALLARAVRDGQNASLLVIGEPGSGKTLLLERALGAVCAEHNVSAANPTVGVVRLHGALHSDERGAFQEIARQLCGAFGCAFSRTASFDDNLGFLREALGQLRRAFKTVVFVIDEVEAYVRVAKQVVLYNLLDALTSSQVQAVVLGVTCQWDVQEAMEKRVRSRFSSRRMVVPPLDHAGGARDEAPRGMLEAMLAPPPALAATPRGRAYLRDVAAALNDARAKAALAELAKIGVTPRDLSAVASAALARWHVAPPAAPFGADCVAAGALAWLRPLASRPLAVAGLSALQLGLLAAARRLEDGGHGTFNFEMVFDEFLKAKHEGLGALWRKPAAWRAFRDVASAGLVQFVAARADSKGLMQQHCAAQLLVTRAELEGGMDLHPACPDHLKRFARGDGAVVASHALV